MKKTENEMREGVGTGQGLTVRVRSEKEGGGPRAQAEIFEVIEREERRSLAELRLKLTDLAGLPRALEELNARLEQLERQVLDVQLEAGRFSKQTGPVLLAVKTLREEIVGGAGELREEIEEHRSQMIGIMASFASETRRYHEGAVRTFSEMMGLLRTEATGLKRTLQVPAHLAAESRRILTETNEVLEGLPGRVDRAGAKWNKALLTLSSGVGDKLKEHSLEVIETHKESSRKLHLTVPLAVVLTIILLNVPMFILLRWRISQDVPEILRGQREVNTETQRKALRWDFEMGRRKLTPDQRRELESSADREIERAQGRSAAGQ